MNNALVRRLIAVHHPVEWAITDYGQVIYTRWAAILLREIAACALCASLASVTAIPSVWVIMAWNGHLTTTVAPSGWQEWIPLAPVLLALGAIYFAWEATRSALYMGGRLKAAWDAEESGTVQVEGEVTEVKPTDHTDPHAAIEAAAARA